MKRAWALAAAWLVCVAVEVSAVGKNPFRGAPPRCPYPGSGIVHVFGWIESVTVVRNPVKHEKKAFLAQPRSPDVWEVKQVLRLHIDSARGREELGPPMVNYPSDYMSTVHGGSSESITESGVLMGCKGLLRFQKRGGELVLERFWPGWYVDEYPKVCWEFPPGLDSLEIE